MSIVVGYIPSPEGVAALNAAVRVAEERGQGLVVVNTGEAGDYSSPRFATAEDVDAIESQLSDRGLEHEVRRPVDGSSAEQAILDAARDVAADLIVIGIRKRSPVGKMLMGSTAQTVLLQAECDVLAVRASRS